MNSERHVIQLLEDERHEQLRSLVCTQLDARLRDPRCGNIVRPYRLLHDIWRELLGTDEAAWMWRARFLATS